MVAYIIAEVEVTDPAAYEKYRKLVAPSLAPYGGRFLVRGGVSEALEGEAPHRMVMLAFETMEAARAWHASTDYAEAKALRLRAAKSRLILVEGV